MEGRDELSGAVYRDVFDGIDDGLVLVDPDSGRIAGVNDAFAELTGADGSALVGRPLASVTNSGNPAAVAYAVAMVERAAAGDPQSFEWTDRDADGAELDLEVRFSPVGGADLVLGVVRDVTAERERERALVRRKERLEEFAGVVSHDLRGPLNVVEGELDRYRETGAAEHLDAVEAASRHLDRVVTDLLDLARDGQTIGETAPTSLEAAARRAWALVDAREATLSVTDDVTIRADLGRLTRALENLFRNAVEHGATCSRTESDDSVEHGSTSDRHPAGTDDAVENGSTSTPATVGDSVEHGSTCSGTRPDAAEGAPASDRDPSGPDATGPATERPSEPLEVRVGPLPDGRGFFVADDGTGIPPAARERAFDPGFTTDADGTGLGLAIVRRIVEAHGWSVAVAESEAGGARFVVRGVTTCPRAEQ